MGKYFKDSNNFIKTGHFKDSQRIAASGGGILGAIDEVFYFLNRFKRIRNLTTSRGYFNIRYLIGVSPKVQAEIESAFNAITAAKKADMVTLHGKATVAQKAFEEDKKFLEYLEKQKESYTYESVGFAYKQERARIDQEKADYLADPDVANRLKESKTLSKVCADFEKGFRTEIEAEIAKFNAKYPNLIETTWNGDVLNPVLNVSGVGVATQKGGAAGPLPRALHGEGRSPDESGAKAVLQSINPISKTNIAARGFNLFFDAIRGPGVKDHPEIAPLLTKTYTFNIKDGRGTEQHNLGEVLEILSQKQKFVNKDGKDLLVTKSDSQALKDDYLKLIDTTAKIKGWRGPLAGQLRDSAMAGLFYLGLITVGKTVKNVIIPKFQGKPVPDSRERATAPAPPPPNLTPARRQQLKRLLNNPERE